MGFNSNVGRQSFAAAGGQTGFTFNFKIYDETDIKVYLTPAGDDPDDTADLLTYGSEYTVSIDGDNGGTVTLLSGATLNDTLVFIRYLNKTRETSYVTNGDLKAATLNLDQDYQTYLIIDGFKNLERVVTLPNTDVTLNPELPGTQQGKYLRVKSDGTGFEYVDLDAVIENLTIVPTVDDFPTGSDGDTCIVQDLDRGGIFIYDSSEVVNDDQGTNFNGWVRQYDGAVNVKWFNDDILLALVAGNGKVKITQDITITSPIPLPNLKVIEIYSDNMSTIVGATGTYIFEQTFRGNMTKIHDINVTGDAILFKYSAQETTLPHATSYQEFRIYNCRFYNVTALYSIYLYGAREGFINNCDFDGAKLVYREKTINTTISNCMVRNSGTGDVITSVSSEGLKIVGTTIIGANIAIRATDEIGITISDCMLDYNDYSILMYACGAVNISSSYITSRTANPAIWIKRADARDSRKIVISNNTISQNTVSGAGSVCLKLDYIINGCVISNNNILGFAGNGIEYTECFGLNITNNIVQSDSATGYSVRYLGTENGFTVVKHNSCSHGILMNTSINRNIVGNTLVSATSTNVKSRNSGTATVANGTTSIVVTHSLAFTPLAGDININLISSMGTATKYWFSTITTSSFTIHIDVVAGVDSVFGWNAEISNRG